mgnify:CR=1 FL=1
MKLFFDTSALIKFFHEEEGTQEVTRLITAEGSELWVSELVTIEFFSALFRRLRNNEITEDKLNEAISGFDEQIALFNIEPLGHAVVTEAESLLKKYGKMQGLRALDALHLGTFSLISEDNWFFVAADNVLCNVVQSMGFKTINPQGHNL